MRVLSCPRCGGVIRIPATYKNLECLACLGMWADKKTLESEIIARGITSGRKDPVDPGYVENDLGNDLELLVSLSKTELMDKMIDDVETVLRSTKHSKEMSTNLAYSERIRLNAEIELLERMLVWMRDNKERL